jgi:hypothetical protein
MRGESVATISTAIMKVSTQDQQRSTSAGLQYSSLLIHSHPCWEKDIPTDSPTSKTRRYRVELAQYKDEEIN